MRHLDRYLQLQALQAAVTSPPHQDLSLSVVIPCLNESGLLPLLDQLQAGSMTDKAVEILVVINHPLDAPEAAKQKNINTLNDLKQWQANHGTPCFQVHAISAFDLPVKTAGVGLARKTGMDEATRRFSETRNPEGVIVSLDADCRVSTSYLSGIINSFAAQPTMHAATIAYAHRLEEISDPQHLRGIISYELFLRYIEMGWRYAELPYAFTSIGSCFAIRADAYARHHGMNKRKAGEDFYFLHKLARERPLGHIDDICVYPSARMSSRTPFGTGQAVAEFCHNGQKGWLVSTPDVFENLRNMNHSLPLLFKMETDQWLIQLPKQMASYLVSQNVEQSVSKMRGHSAGTDSFKRHFYTWFDGLKAWRYVNSQSDSGIPVERAACRLLDMCNMPEKWNSSSANESSAMLKLVRRFEQVDQIDCPAGSSATQDTPA